MIPKNAEDHMILKRLKDERYVNKFTRINSYQMSGEDKIINVDYLEEPMFTLEIL